MEVDEEIKKILERLPNLNCKECGFSSCKEMAEAIYKGKADFNDCVVLSTKKEVVVRINDREVPLGKFVQSFVKNVVIGMISSLKKAEFNEGDTIEIRVKVGKKGE